MTLIDKTYFRNQRGLTLPFALILTFIFSALVGVSYLFVSINLRQMESSVHSMQAISIAEGINERIKARLNTKNKMQLSPEQEERLKLGEEGEEEEAEDIDEDILEDEFDEGTEDFDEYYADEILKISRFITFREPPKEEAPDEGTEVEVTTEETENKSKRAEANVDMIGSIEVPRGLVLNKGTKLVILKDEKIDLKLQDIVGEKTLAYKPKLPIPIIKSLSPNYSEGNKRGYFVVHGIDISYDQKSRFSNKDIYIEDIKGGPTVDFFVGADVMPGVTRFYWESSPCEFYIIPTFDVSPKPIITDVKSQEGNQLLEAKAGSRRLVIMIYGNSLYQRKSQPVVIGDVAGIFPKVKSQNDSGNEVTINLDIDKKVEPGIHSLVLATEGGLSNSWVFNVLPPDEKEADFSNNFATVSSALTLLDIRVVEDVLPLIDEGQEEEKVSQNKNNVEGENLPEEPEISEKAKLSVFANDDLETVWLLQTTSMVGKITKTISELIHRQIPNINAGLITNGNVTFEGGNYQIIGTSTAMTTLTESTYISNTILFVEGVPEGLLPPLAQLPDEQSRAQEAQTAPKSPLEVGFFPGTLAAVYKAGDRISDLDYGVISKLGTNTIELMPPGLMDFHYEEDQVYQFIPPVISREKISTDEAEKHIVPKDYAITIPNYAKFKNIFRSNIDEFAELADLYSTDPAVPKDEYDLPLGYMALTYIDATPTYDESNTLSGKGILIIDTRADNLGKPTGEVTLTGDSKNPIEFKGLLYIHGNLKIDGNVNIDGAVVVDNESRGQVQISSNAIGKITYDPRILKQTILYAPFTTKPGTVAITNKPIDLSGYVESGTGPQLGVAPALPGTQALEGRPSEPRKINELLPEEAIVETIKPEERPKAIETRPQDIVPTRPGKKSAEEELIDLF